MTTREKDLLEIQSFLEMPCAWSVGPLMDQFYAGLQNKKVMGIECPKCHAVYVPPREVCTSCWKPTAKMVELEGKGKLVNFTVAHVDFRGAKLDAPIVIGLVRLSGADTAMYGEIKNVALDKVKLGMKVRAVWADEPKGSVKDLHFEPL